MHTFGLCRIVRHSAALSRHKLCRAVYPSKHYSYTIVEDSLNMDLKTVTRRLKAFAPTSLAGSWDNVGLLIEPSPPHAVSSMLITNDLTEAVMLEAINKKVNMILSYHPPIFRPLKQLTQSQWKEQIVIKCIENRIALYSPHTTYDAVSGGLSDWLISPFVGKVSVLQSQTATDYPAGGGYRLEVTIASDQSPLGEQLQAEQNITLTTCANVGETATRMTFNCTEKSLSKAVEIVNTNDDVRKTMEIFQSVKPPIPNTGAGRKCVLSKKASIHDVVRSIKQHLKLNHVRLAVAKDCTTESMVGSIAVCAGSGSDVLRGVKTDIWLTGELSHHEILDANHSGTSVILCDHTNTERGYFDELRTKLNPLFDSKVSIYISEMDRDPLEIV